MSSFFTTPSSQRKRKRQEHTGVASTSRKRYSNDNNSSGRGSFHKKDQPKKKQKRNDEHHDDDNNDESISGSDSGGYSSGAAEGAGPSDDGNASDSDEANETAAGRRLKLAERYLDNIRAEVEDEQRVGFDAAEVDRELIAARLKEDVAQDKGKIYRFIANDLDFSHSSNSFFRADTLATLAVAICLPYVYTASKDMRLIKWELASRNAATEAPNTARKRKPRLIRYTCGNKNRAGDSKYQHHTAPILCIAASPDGRFVVTGGADRRLIVWEPSSLKPLKVFTHHRDAVTGLAFRGNTNQLFSASKDRTVKIWSLNELAYVETLFGHQDEVVDVAAVGQPQERCVSVGARDRTARLWKVVDESQLVFRGGGTCTSSVSKHDHLNNGIPTADVEDSLPSFAEGSLDRVTQIDSQLFVTGSDSGALSLFSLHKKKPLHVYPLAHGRDPPPPPSRSSAEADSTNVDVGAPPTPRWITALKAIPFSDLFVSGSWDGVVRVWRVAETEDGERDDVATHNKAKGVRRIEPVAVLGRDEMLDSSITQDGDGNGIVNDNRIRGVINDLAVVELGERGKDGVCIVAAVGTEPRLGRWMKIKGKNGAIVFQVPRHLK